MKSTWFPDKTQYEFAQIIEDAGRRSGHRMWELFDGFLFCAFASFRQAVYKLTTGELNAQLEEDYLKRIRQFEDPNKFPEALAVLVRELEREPRDFLGDVYQALGMADKDFAGQCFTPMPICHLMANMVLGDAEPDPSNRLTLSEPCVGGGAMAIAAVELLKKKGFGPLNFFLHGTDISSTCFHMAYIQLTLLGIPAVITRGNSLWPTDDDTHAPTFVGALYPLRDHQRNRAETRLEIHARSRSRQLTLPTITARSRSR